MGIIMGALSGLGEGLATYSGWGIQNQLAEERDEKRAQIEAQAQENMLRRRAEIEQQMAADNRKRVGGIITDAQSKGRAAAMANGPVTPDVMDKTVNQTVSDALFAAGDVEAGKIYSDTSAKAAMNDIQLKRIQEASAYHTAMAGIKERDGLLKAAGRQQSIQQLQERSNRIDKEVDDAVSRAWRDKMNPFRIPGEDRKDAVDTAKVSLAKDFIGGYMQAQLAAGKNVSVRNVLNEAAPQIEEYDRLVIAKVRGSAKALFDDKDASKSTREEFENMGAPLDSKEAFSRWYRDQLLNPKDFVGFLRAQKAAKQGGAKYPGSSDPIWSAVNPGMDTEPQFLAQGNGLIAGRRGNAAPLAE